MTKISVIGEKLIVYERDAVLGGSAENKMKLTFSDDWAQMTKQVDFINTVSRATRRVSADSALVRIPWEVLKDAGDLVCRVRGVNSNGKLVKLTDTAELGTVLDLNTDADEGAEPTPSVSDKLIGELGELDELETVNKSSLVAAINELRRSVSGVVYMVHLNATGPTGEELVATEPYADVRAAILDGRHIQVRYGAIVVAPECIVTDTEIELSLLSKEGMDVYKYSFVLTPDNKLAYELKELVSAQTLIEEKIKLEQTLGDINAQINELKNKG